MAREEGVLDLTDLRLGPPISLGGDSALGVVDSEAATEDLREDAGVVSIDCDSLVTSFFLIDSLRPAGLASSAGAGAAAGFSGWAGSATFFLMDNLRPVGGAAAGASSAGLGFSGSAAGAASAGFFLMDSFFAAGAASSLGFSCSLGFSGSSVFCCFSGAASFFLMESFRF